MFSAIKATVGLRVSAEEEIAGLDVEEHGSNAYPDLLPTPELASQAPLVGGAIAGD